jgi:hypothetical protein
MASRKGLSPICKIKHRLYDGLHCSTKRIPYRTIPYKTLCKAKYLLIAYVLIDSSNGNSQICRRFFLGGGECLNIIASQQVGVRKSPQYSNCCAEAPERH